ncbi:MAG: GntR family transcriptional regulator [Acidobacteria bacterium]|nr:GntR family transcriptional regulator [Acidobacteriota bacterium]
MSQFTGNLTEQVYTTIRNRILRGELRFGAPLSRRVLAEELGVSIVPVGDALQRLEGDGLVESRPRVGTRVRVPTARSIRGHYILREALESQAARIFSEKASPEERDEIRRLAHQLDALYLLRPDESTPDRLFEIHLFHMRFHMRIAECTGCDELCQAVEKNQVLIFNWLYDTALDGQAPPSGWHSELAGVLVGSDPEQSDAAMRRHTRYRMEEVLIRMEPYFGWGDRSTVEFSKRPRRKAAPPESPEGGRDQA